MGIFLEPEYIFLDCESLPQTMDTFSQMSTPTRIPTERIVCFFPPRAATSLECSIVTSFVIVGHSLLMTWATSLGFALWSGREVLVCFFLITALQSLEVSF